MAERTCLQCGWVAFGISRTHAECEVERFNKYIDRLAEEEDMHAYGDQRASIETYERCFHCGGSYQNFRQALPNDAPNGVTLQMIINPFEF